MKSCEDERSHSIEHVLVTQHDRTFLLLLGSERKCRRPGYRLAGVIT